MFLLHRKPTELRKQGKTQIFIATTTKTTVIKENTKTQIFVATTTKTHKIMPMRITESLQRKHENNENLQFMRKRISE